MWAVIGWKLKAWIDFLAAALIDNIFFESNADAYISFDCELMGYFWLNFLHLCIRQVLDLPYSLYFGFGWCVTNTKQYTERAQCIVPIVSLVFLRNAERLHYVFYFTLGSPGSSAPWPTESTQYRHKSGIGNMNRMGIWRIRHAMATTNSRGIWIFSVCVYGGRFPTASVSFLCTGLRQIKSRSKKHFTYVYTCTKSTGESLPKIGHSTHATVTHTYWNRPIHFLWCYRQLLCVDFLVQRVVQFVYENSASRIKWHRCGRISSFQIHTEHPKRPNPR